MTWESVCTDFFLNMIQKHNVMREKNNSAEYVGSDSDAPNSNQLHENWEYSLNGLIFYRLSYEDTYFSPRNSL